MMDFLARNAGLIGLLFFFTFFCVMAVWIYRPRARNTYNNHARIPFEENDQ